MQFFLSQSPLKLFWPTRCQQKSIGNFLGKLLLGWTKLTPPLPTFPHLECGETAANL